MANVTLEIAFRSLAGEKPNDPVTVLCQEHELNRLEAAWKNIAGPEASAIHALKAFENAESSKLYLRLELIAYIWVRGG